MTRPVPLKQYGDAAKPFLDAIAAMVAADVVREVRDAKRQRPQVRREHPVIVNLGHLDPDDEPDLGTAEAVVRGVHEQRRRKFGWTLDDVVDSLTREVQRQEDGA